LSGREQASHGYADLIQQYTMKQVVTLNWNELTRHQLLRVHKY